MMIPINQSPRHYQLQINTNTKASFMKRGEGSGHEISCATEMGELAQEYLSLLLKGDREQASTLVMDALNGGLPVKEIYLTVFQPVMYEVGRLWEINSISVAVEHFCTAVTQTIMSKMYPFIFIPDEKEKSVVACCVGNDLHQLGLRMVCDFFEMDGWDTFFMGSRCDGAALVSVIQERKAELLCLSITMHHNNDYAKHAIATVREHCKDVRILVGGYSILCNPDLAEELGADGAAKDAQEALAVASSLM